MLSYTQLLKAEAIFSHMQVIPKNHTLQAWQKDREHDPYFIFCKDIKKDLSATWCYVNFPLSELRAFHFRIWDKRKKEIQSNNFSRIYSDEKVIRFGFY